MSINAYCGVMGSGKSYEVVSGPLLDAVAAGRRVVTNIDGVNEDLIHGYVHEKRGVPIDRLGRIVHVRTDDLKEDGFFPLEVEGSGGATVTPGFVLPGDLLVIDEAWKLWASDQKISREHMSFFRMHRHFVHEETGVACDVVLMIQSIADLHRSIKAVVELSFRMVKLKSLGFSRTYRVEMYETSKQTSGNRTGTFVRKYKAEIFPLYKSYAGAGGTESTVDGRQNVLARKSLWFLAGGVLLLGLVGFWFAFRFFHGGAVEDMTHKAHTSGGKGSHAAAASVPGQEAPENSASWRIAGGYSVDGRSYVLLANGDGRLRAESPSVFMGNGIERVGMVEGQRVAEWSGQVGGLSTSSKPLVGGTK